MRLCWITAGTLAVMTSCFGANIALNKPVTLNGSFPEFAWCSGSPAPQPAAASVVDGVFFPDETCWQSGVYWQGTTNSIDIDLGGEHTLTGAIVQADDNDTYLLQYRDSGGTYHDWWNIPAPGGWGLRTRPNVADNSQVMTLPTVAATGLRFSATGGDGFYSVSEIQAFGTTVPEPASIALAAAGLGALLLRRRLRSN